MPWPCSSTTTTSRRRTASTAASASCRPEPSCRSMAMPLRRHDELPAPVPYWRWPQPSSTSSLLQDDADAIARLDETLRRAVRRQMMADVPLGAFLSGGIDSSTIVAMMQAQSTRPVQDVHHRLSRSGLRRGQACQGSRATPGDRPHRALRHLAGCACRHPGTAAVLRRAVLRLLADPHAPARAADTQARDRIAVRRRGRRTLWRLFPVPAHRAGLVVDQSHAGVGTAALRGHDPLAAGAGVEQPHAAGPRFPAGARAQPRAQGPQVRGADRPR